MRLCLISSVLDLDGLAGEVSECRSLKKTKQESQQRAEIKYLAAGLTFSLIFPPSSRFNFILLKGTEIIDIIPTVVRGQCVPTTTHNTFRRVLPQCSLKDEFHQRFFKSIFRILYIGGLMCRLCG